VKKIAVFSDTHHNYEFMLETVLTVLPDAVIHCGDGCDDTLYIDRILPVTPVYRVVGNCDYNSTIPVTTTVTIEGWTILITHGHRYFGVREGNIDSLVYAAQEAGATVVCYGHTHIPLYKEVDGVTVLNPGSAGIGSHLSWGLLTLTEESLVWDLHYMGEK